MAIMHERLKELRIQKGLTLAQIADQLGVTEATAQRYETGKGIKTVPYEVIEKYAVLFNCQPQYILGWETIQKNNDIIADIVVRLRTDSDFLSVVENLNNLNEEQLRSVKQMLSAFIK